MSSPQPKLTLQEFMKLPERARRAMVLALIDASQLKKRMIMAAIQTGAAQVIAIPLEDANLQDAYIETLIVVHLKGEQDDFDREFELADLPGPTTAFLIGVGKRKGMQAICKQARTARYEQPCMDDYPYNDPRHDDLFDWIEAEIDKWSPKQAAAVLRLRFLWYRSGRAEQPTFDEIVHITGVAKATASKYCRDFAEHSRKLLGDA